MNATSSRANWRVGEVRHASGQVWCAPRCCPALVSIVERRHLGGVLRSVVWCSLRGNEQYCTESCLLDPGVVDGAGAAGFAWFELRQP